MAMKRYRIEVEYRDYTKNYYADTFVDAQDRGDVELCWNRAKSVTIYDGKEEVAHGRNYNNY